MARTRPQAEADELEREADAEAEVASETAQEEARREAADKGVTLSDQQLELIGRHAAEETHRLFERAGAFKREEPAPPPPPPPPQDAEHVDDAPRPKPTGVKGTAAKFLGERS